MSIETWTAERIEQLRHCVGSGLTCSQIAAEIGVTRNAVIGKIHRLGLSPARPAGASARSCPPRARHPLDRPGGARRSRRRRCGASADRQRATLLAARDRARQVPLAARRSARRGFCVLRQCGGHRLLILRRSRPHGLSGAGAPARLTRVGRPVTPRRPLRRGYFAFGTRQRNGVAFHLMLLRTGPCWQKSIMVTIVPVRCTTGPCGGGGLAALIW
jgi:hypothetical protein